MLRPWTFALIGAGALALGPPLSFVRADAAPNAQPGVEAQARGPLHEAFAQPVDDQPRPGPLAPKEPPPLIDEIPPDQKPVGDNVQWISGYWQWDDEQKQFLWISGFWRQIPPGCTWHPGVFTKMAAGWQWTAGYWSGGATPQPVLTAPPAAVQTRPATQPPSNNCIAVPGIWVYRDARYRWRAPYYLDSRPGWVWHPAQYVWTPDGYVFVDGYWDYPLTDRGLLFAPVAIDPSLLGRPHWTYTPSYVVNSAFLPTALFVRAGWNHYYFGDYFGAGCAQRGFTPWFDYRFGGGYSDPLFAYQRFATGDPNWERDLRGVYADRFNGTGVLPPRTWQEQVALIGRVMADPSLLADNYRYALPLAPLAWVNRQALKLRNVSAVERRALIRQLRRSSAPVRGRRTIAAPPRSRHKFGLTRTLRTKRTKVVTRQAARKPTKATGTSARRRGGKT